MKLSPFKIKKMKSLLKESLFNTSNILSIRSHQNVTDTTTSNSQIKLTPLYRVLFATYPNEVEKFTIITDDWSLRSGTNIKVCFKRVSKKYAESRPRSDKWINNVTGGAYYKTNTIVNIKEFIKELNSQSFVSWIDMLNYLVDGTGEADKRITEVMKSLVLKLPLEQSRLWQAFNNHTVMITNPGTGKSSSFERISGVKPRISYTMPGLFGTIDFSTGDTKEGDLFGNGTYAFDEFPEQYDTRHENVLKDLLNYLANGSSSRSLAGKVISIEGCKAVTFFGNVPGDWDIHGFNKMLTKLAGYDSLDRAGRRFGIVLYGNEFNIISGSECDPKLISNIQSVIETMQKKKHTLIKRLLLHYKHWITEKDDEFISFFEDITKYVMDNQVKMFIKGFKNSWNRVKFAALKKVILENLPYLYTLKYKELLSHLTPLIYMAYEQFKTYNYRSFEFLYHNKKHGVLDLINRGFDYDAIIELGIDISPLIYKEWKREYDENPHIPPIST